ncbi:hypothetical protein [Virgibacillus pantothenticus]|nr:hypothetical protein [Virgibacillus pantothenticus]QTY15131.1 hypothetical protein KBP50_14605 [Virgibacillus pantothenticus]SIT04574.1 hypothetical protein SAMN05421787_1123 [Virgibacillus pantothenticus]
MLKRPLSTTKKKALKNLTGMLQYSTAQILSETVDDKGNKDQLIAVTVFNDIELKEEGAKIRTLGDKGNEELTPFVRAYNRIYYQNSTDRGVAYAKLTRVTGGWEVFNPLTTLSNRVVRYGSSGRPNGSQATVKYPIGNTYSYKTPSSWKRTALTGSYAIGTNSTVTVKRGSSTWTVKVKTNL